MKSTHFHYFGWASFHSWSFLVKSSDGFVWNLLFFIGSSLFLYNFLVLSTPVSTLIMVPSVENEFIFMAFFVFSLMGIESLGMYVLKVLRTYHVIKFHWFSHQGLDSEAWGRSVLESLGMYVLLGCFNWDYKQSSLVVYPFCILKRVYGTFGNSEESSDSKSASIFSFLG